MDRNIVSGILASVALVMHRFRRSRDRSRYDATRTLDLFSVHLRDEVHLDAVRDELLGAVRDTVRPAYAGVWLRERWIVR